MNADRDASSRPVFDLIRQLPCCEVSAMGEIETRSLSADVVTDLGFLLAELADLSAQCDLIATSCRRATADYLPLVLRARVEPDDGHLPKS